MQTFKVKKAKINGVSRYLWEVYYRGLFKYKPFCDYYFSTKEDAMRYIYKEIGEINCKIKVEDGD